MATDKDKFEVMQGVIDLRDKQIKRLKARLKKVTLELKCYENDEKDKQWK